MTPMTWVNTPVNDELLKKLDEMVMDDFSDRAKFVRKLISQEWERRLEENVRRQESEKA